MTDFNGGPAVTVVLVNDSNALLALQVRRQWLWVARLSLGCREAAQAACDDVDVDLGSTPPTSTRRRMNVTMQMLLLLPWWQQRAQMMLTTIFRTRPIDPQHLACSGSSTRRLALVICITHVVQYKFHFALLMWVFFCVFVSRDGVAELSAALHYGTLVALSCVKCVFGRGAFSLGWLRSCRANQRLHLHASQPVQFISKVIAWCIILWVSIIASYLHGPRDRYPGLCAVFAPGLISMVMVARGLGLVVMLEHCFGAMLCRLCARASQSTGQGVGAGFARAQWYLRCLCTATARRPERTPKQRATKEQCVCSISQLQTRGEQRRASARRTPPPPHRRSAVVRR